MSNRIRITIAYFQRQDRKRKAKASLTTEKSKPKKWMWACSGSKEVCTQHAHVRMECAVHGTKDAAIRCCRKYSKAREGR